MLSVSSGSVLFPLARPHNWIQNSLVWLPFLFGLIIKIKSEFTDILLPNHRGFCGPVVCHCQPQRKFGSQFMINPRIKAGSPMSCSVCLVSPSKGMKDGFIAFFNEPPQEAGHLETWLFNIYLHPPDESLKIFKYILLLT